MRLRCLSGVLMVCGTGLLAGCPLGLDLSGLLDGSYSSGEMIADGSYTGAWESTTELWQGGERVWTGPNEGQLNVAFSDGAVLKANGDWLDVGDVEHLDMGTLQITREAYSIDYGDWGYEVAFDLTAEWKNAPMAGT